MSNHKEAGRRGGRAFAARLSPRKRKAVGAKLAAARAEKQTPERRLEINARIKATKARKKLGVEQVLSVPGLVPSLEAIASERCAQEGKWGLYLVSPIESPAQLADGAPCLMPSVLDGSLPAEGPLLVLFTDEARARAAYMDIDAGWAVIPQLIGPDGRVKFR